MERHSMRLSHVVLSALAVAPCALASPAHAQPEPTPAAPSEGDAAPRRVAIIPQLAVNVDDRRVDALTEELAETLHQRLVVDAIGGSDVARRLPSDGLPDDCLAQPACVADLGSRLDADELIFVVLVQVGQDIQVDATWIDVASGRSVSRPRLVLDAEARAGTVFGDAATRLLPDAEVRSRTVVVSMPTGPARRMTLPAWITAGASVALIGTSVGFALSTRSSYNRCERSDRCDSDELDTIETRALTADVAAGLAVGAAIATGVLWYFSGGDEPEATRGLGVEAAPGSASLIYGGRF
jgi:hypothetical protein